MLASLVILFFIVVAPHAGAWIEMGPMEVIARQYDKSLPTRERGLKLSVIQNRPTAEGVAPHAGAWIEMILEERADNVIESLPTRERGLKSIHRLIDAVFDVSLPTRERGLKYVGLIKCALLNASLPTRERGLKYRRTVGCAERREVAPHAGAWIEIYRS